MSQEIKDYVAKGIKYMCPWISDEHLDGAVQIAQGMSLCVQHELHSPDWAAEKDGQVKEMAQKYLGKYCIS